MNYDGFLIVSDSISSFPRDHIPFEQRIIKNYGKGKSILARKIAGKNAAHCLEIIRNKSLSLESFSSSVPNPRAYILLGFSESRYNNNPTWETWFNSCMKSMAVELEALGFYVCFCLPHVESKSIPSEHRKWLKNASEKINGWAIAHNCETLKISLKAARDWRYPDYSSISKLSKQLADDYRDSLLVFNEKSQKTIRKKGGGCEPFSTRFVIRV